VKKRSHARRVVDRSFRRGGGGTARPVQEVEFPAMVSFMTSGAQTVGSAARCGAVEDPNAGPGQGRGSRADLPGGAVGALRAQFVAGRPHLSHHGPTRCDGGDGRRSRRRQADPADAAQVHIVPISQPVLATASCASWASRSPPWSRRARRKPRIFADLVEVEIGSDAGSGRPRRPPSRGRARGHAEAANNVVVEGRVRRPDSTINSRRAAAHQGRDPLASARTLAARAGAPRTRPSPGESGAGCCNRATCRRRAGSERRGVLPMRADLTLMRAPRPRLSVRIRAVLTAALHTSCRRFGMDAAPRREGPARRPSPASDRYSTSTRSAISSALRARRDHRRRSARPRERNDAVATHRLSDRHHS